jgi:hypothetical protein
MHMVGLPPLWLPPFLRISPLNKPPLTLQHVYLLICPPGLQLVVFGSSHGDQPVSGIHTVGAQ